MRYKVSGEFYEGGFSKIFDKMLEDPNDVIVLEINSPGGDSVMLGEALAKVYELKERGKKVVTYVTGEACSAAACLAWRGDEIYLAPCAIVMFHRAYWATFRTLFQSFVFWLRKKLNPSDDALIYLNRVLEAYIPWNLILAFKKKKSKKRDYYFTAEEALHLGSNVVIGIPPYQVEYYKGDSDDDDDDDDEVEIRKKVDQVRRDKTPKKPKTLC